MAQIKRLVSKARFPGFVVVLYITVIVLLVALSNRLWFSPVDRDQRVQIIHQSNIQVEHHDEVIQEPEKSSQKEIQIEAKPVLKVESESATEQDESVETTEAEPEETTTKEDPYLLKNFKLPPEADVIPKFARDTGGSIQTVIPLKFSSCIIFKNMHSVLETVNCYLQPDNVRRHDKDQVMGLNLSDPHIWRPEGCFNAEARKERQEIIPALHRTTIFNKEKDWTTLVLVRHPIARLISSWVHFCDNDHPLFGGGRVPKEQMCYGCMKNISCFIYENRDFHLEMAKDKRILKPGTPEGLHYRPQNWQCQFSAHLNDYTHVLQYERSNSFNDKFFEVLKKIGTPKEKYDKIYTAFHGRDTLHTTYFNPVRQKLTETILNSPDLITAILQTYYHDFTLFGFDSLYPYSDR